MRLMSNLLGEQEIDEQTVVTFIEGLTGFEEQRRYKLFHQEGQQALYWLQSLDDPQLTFSLTTPEQLGLAYEVVLSDEEAGLLQVGSPEEVAILLLLYRDESEAVPLPSGGQRVKANIHGPLLFNVNERLALQKRLPRLEQTILLRAPAGE